MPEQVREILAPLSSLKAAVAPGRICIAQGHGSQPKAVYDHLRTLPGVQVLWDAPMLPWFMYPLRFIAACHGGLLRFTDTAIIPNAMEMLGDCATAQLFFTTEPMLLPSLNLVKRKQWIAFIGDIIQAEDASYFCMGIGGNTANETGCSAWVGWGRECPAEFVRYGESLIKSNVAAG